jgi:hypothetical protein
MLRFRVGTGIAATSIAHFYFRLPFGLAFFSYSYVLSIIPAIARAVAGRPPCADWNETLWIDVQTGALCAWH